MFKRWFAFPIVRFLTAAVLILALALTFPGTRAVTGKLLNPFRNQHGAVVPDNFNGLEQLASDDTRPVHG